MIPRLDCLGLIEASTSSTCQMCIAGFRGLIASASLKPRPGVGGADGGFDSEA